MIRHALWGLLLAAFGAAADVVMVDGPGNVGRYSSLATGTGALFLSYYDVDNGDLKVASCTGTCDRPGAAWIATTVDSPGDVGLYTSLSSNGAGNPVVAYYDATNASIKLATCTAACATASPTWIITTVDKGVYPSLLGGNNPMIAYYDRANGDLKLARCTAACATAAPTWAISILDGPGDVGRFPAMRSDFTGAVAIAYADVSNARLKVAVCKSGCTGASASWILTSVDSLAPTDEMRMSVALNEGAPSVSYFDAAVGLKLATCNTACGTTEPQWVVTVVDRAGEAGRFSALVLNGHVPAIVYSGTIRSCNGAVCHEVDDLRAAECGMLPAQAKPDTPCGITTLDRGGAGLDPTMLRFGDSISFAYYDARGHDVKFTTMKMDEGLGAPQNYTSLWWDAEESGWGINFSQQGDLVFGTLFTYDASGAPMWLVMSAGRKQSANLFSGELYRTTGPPFNAQPFTPIGPSNITQVGTMTVAFADDSAALTYGVNGATVNKTLRRQVFGAPAARGCGNVTVAERIRLSRPPNSPHFQDLWWNPNESGWGINFAHQGDTLFGTLFTYDAAGRGTWFVMSAGRKQSDGSYAGELYRTTGPAFNAAPFTPIGSGQITQVGVMQVTFSDIENGVLTYTVNGVTVTKSITRQVFSSPVPIC